MFAPHPVAEGFYGVSIAWFLDKMGNCRAEAKFSRQIVTSALAEKQRAGVGVSLEFVLPKRRS
jgi:hypothetical protein